MGEMSDYYSGLDNDPYDAINPEEKESIKENRKPKQYKIILQGYKNGEMFIDREINLSEEQRSFFNVVGKGNSRFKITVEDVEEIHGWAHEEYEYFLEIK